MITTKMVPGQIFLTQDVHGSILDFIVGVDRHAGLMKIWVLRNITLVSDNSHTHEFFSLNSFDTKLYDGWVHLC